MNASTAKIFVAGAVAGRRHDNDLLTSGGRVLACSAYGSSFKEAWEDEEYREAVIEETLRDLGYLIEPQFLFSEMVIGLKSASFRNIPFSTC